MNVIHTEIAATLDYCRILREADKDNLIPTVQEALVYSCFEAYEEMTQRNINVCLVTLGTFEYVFDDLATLQDKGDVAASPESESRLVVAIGTSAVPVLARKSDDNRLKGWVGRTETVFGKAWDKGHFIAHSIGGAVDLWEVNVYKQNRKLNRGWSEAGGLYRLMENYCASNPGVLCFSRPIYFTGLACPCVIEFGVLRRDRSWWIEQFDNRTP